ncbi:hypothetical protein [Rhizobium sp. HT1-10]|uniref:hypothetical protein n=1 Tax=Rhizobium sp. HT1-10 TaxID=3111638 RepID=UPI003C248D47
MSDVIRNERAKLIANAFDRASTACFTVGIATPIAGMVYNITSSGTLTPLRLALSLLGWLFLAFLLHDLARRSLRSLRT